MLAALGMATVALLGLTAISDRTADAPEPPARAAVAERDAASGRLALRTVADALRWRALDAALGPPRVGIQVGHLAAAEQPPELAKLRYSTGGHADGLDEVDVNLAVAEALARELEAAGVDAELLPATVPPDYRADLLISVHADSSPAPWRRGYKSAHFQPARNRLEPRLKALVDAAYLRASALPDDHENITGAMLRYYAFNHRAYRHSVSPHTPALIVELGYISHPQDRAFLERPEAVAQALTEGVLAFLDERGRLAAR